MFHQSNSAAVEGSPWRDLLPKFGLACSAVRLRQSPIRAMHLCTLAALSLPKFMKDPG